MDYSPPLSQKRAPEDEQAGGTEMDAHPEVAEILTDGGASKKLVQFSTWRPSSEGEEQREDDLAWEDLQPLQGGASRPRKTSLRSMHASEDAAMHVPTTQSHTGDALGNNVDCWSFDRVMYEILDNLEQQLSRGFLTHAQQMASLRYQLQNLMVENGRLRQELARHFESSDDELQVPDDELHGCLRPQPPYASATLTAKATSLASAMYARHKGVSYQTGGRREDTSQPMPNMMVLPEDSKGSALYECPQYSNGLPHLYDANLAKASSLSQVSKRTVQSSQDASDGRQLRSAAEGDGLVRGNTTTTVASKRSTKSSKVTETEDFELLPFWTQSAEKAQMFSAKSTSRRSVMNSRNVPQHRHISSGWSGMRSAYTVRDLGSMVANPMSRNRIFWESVGILCITYDLVVVPLQAFNFGQSSWRRFATWFTIMYWTCDIPCSFFVAYYHRGILQSRTYKTAKHYLRTWFVLDAVIITFDWIVVWYEHQDSHSADEFKYVKAGRSLRMLRFLRLLRLLRLHSFFSKMMEQIHSEYVLTILHIVKLIILIVVVNHFVACCWYALGDMLTGQFNWVDVFTPDDDIGYRYTTSLHWSLTQFTPASMEVVPTNTAERTYCVFVVICAMVLFSSFVSSITEAMTHLRKINSARNTQYAMVRRYFGDRQVSMPLAMRIWRYLEQCVQARKRRKMFQDVELLKELPDGLQMDLLGEVFEPSLTRHPFFHQYMETNPAGSRALCHQACQESSLFAGQDLFHFGAASHRMYFSVDGTLDYHISDTGDIMSMTPGMWACEYSLWVHWYHVGTMVSRTSCLILHLDVAQTHAVMKQYVDSLWQCCQYAQLSLMNLQENLAEGISDLYMDFDKIQDMSQRAFDLFGERVAGQESMRSSVSRIMSLTGTQSASRAHFWHGSWLPQLLKKTRTFSSMSHELGSQAMREEGSQRDSQSTIDGGRSSTEVHTMGANLRQRSPEGSSTTPSVSLPSIHSTV